MLTIQEESWLELRLENFKTKGQRIKKYRGACAINLNIFSFHCLYLFYMWVQRGPQLSVGDIC